MLAACGGTKRASAARAAGVRLQGPDRRATWSSHDISGDERGVQIDCAEAGPRIKRWKTDKNGTRQEDARALTPGEFDNAWQEVDGHGLGEPQGLHERHRSRSATRSTSSTSRTTRTRRRSRARRARCPTRTSTSRTRSTCSAWQGVKQLGDDEPADAKALDKKDKQTMSGPLGGLDRGRHRRHARHRPRDRACALAEAGAEVALWARDCERAAHGRVRDRGAARQARARSLSTSPTPAPSTAPPISCARRCRRCARS